MSLGFTLTLTLPEDQFFTRKYSTENREATGGKDRWESLGEMITLFYISFNILLFNQSNIVFMHLPVKRPTSKNRNSRFVVSTSSHDALTHNTRLYCHFVVCARCLWQTGRVCSRQWTSCTRNWSSWGL